jgi:hypothetical protein
MSSLIFIPQPNEALFYMAWWRERPAAAGCHHYEAVILRRSRRIPATSTQPQFSKASTESVFCFCPCSSSRNEVRDPYASHQSQCHRHTLDRSRTGRTCISPSHTEHVILRRSRRIPATSTQPQFSKASTESVFCFCPCSSSRNEVRDPYGFNPYVDQSSLTGLGK